jgi:hypothetical protein
MKREGKFEFVILSVAKILGSRKTNCSASLSTIIKGASLQLVPALAAEFIARIVRRPAIPAI